MKKLFFSQGMLDSMIDAGKIKVDLNILTMLAGDNPTFTLFPAYRFVKTIEGGADPNGLVGQIRSEHDLKEMQAEVYLDSIIYQDVAYQADPGYIAEKIVPGQEAAPKAEEPTEQPPSDSDQLSKFILDNLG